MMLIVKEDKEFNYDILLSIVEDSIKIKKQRKGGLTAIKNISKRLNLEERLISKKMIEANILRDNSKWTVNINNNEPIKIIKLNGQSIVVDWDKKTVNIEKEVKIEKTVNIEKKRCLYKDTEEVFKYFKEKFPKHSRKKLDNYRFEKIKESIIKHDVEYSKRVIDSFFYYSLIQKRTHKNIHDDIKNIFGFRITEDNYNKHDERKRLVFDCKKDKTNIYPKKTAIHQAIVDFCNINDNGAFELCCPTGTGKTYSAIEFMTDFIRTDKSNKILVYLTRQKTNLEEPIKDLNKVLTESEKKNNLIFKIKSVEDLLSHLNDYKNDYRSLFFSTLKGDSKNKAIKALDEISFTVDSKGLNSEQKNKLCGNNVDIIRKIIANNFNIEKYKALKNNEKESLYALFPLNKIEDGGCKVLATTINKAISNTHKLTFKNNKAEIKTEKIISLKYKNKQQRKNDIFIIDESQNFVPTVSQNNIDNTVTFPLLDLIKSINDRFFNSEYEENENDLKHQIHIVTDVLFDVFKKYNLHNKVQIINKENNEEVYTYLLDYDVRTLLTEKSKNLFFNIYDDKNIISSVSESENNYNMSEVIHDLKNIIFKFQSIIITSYRKFLDEKFSCPDSNKINDPINLFVIEKQLDHNKTIEGFVKKILGIITPNIKDKTDSICDIYEIIKENIQLVNLRTKEDLYASLDLIFSEGDGNKTLLDLAKKNKVVLLSGTADARTVIENSHIDFLEYNLNKESNTTYLKLSEEQQKAIMDGYDERFPDLKNIQRNVIPITVESDATWESKMKKELKSLDIKLMDSMKIISEISNLDKDSRSYYANRISKFIFSVTDFLNNDNSQIMLSCHQKFNYINFFKDELKEFNIKRKNYNIEACMKFIVSRSKYSKDFKNGNIIIKSFDADGYRNNIAEDQINEIKKGQKFILMGTIKSIGQGANIVFNIKDRKTAKEMGYILIDSDNSSNAAVKACIDTIYIEKTSHTLNLSQREEVGYEKYCADYYMRTNLLYSTNKEMTSDKRRKALYKIHDRRTLEKIYTETSDYNNNSNASLKQMLGRIPRGNAYKKEINIILDNKYLQCVSNADQGNIDYNTFEFKEVYDCSRMAFKPSKSEKMKNMFKYTRFENASFSFESEQKKWNNKVVDSKFKYRENPTNVNYEHLLKCKSNKEKFNKLTLESLKNRDSFDVKNVYHKFETDRYYYNVENGNIEISTKLASKRTFGYDDLNAELICKLLNLDNSKYPELDKDFDKTILPVPSMTYYLKGFRAEEYGETILKDKLNANILTINPVVYEDFDCLVEVLGKKLAIDFKYSEMDEYNASQEKVNRVKSVYPDAKYVVVNVFSNNISKNYKDDISRFSCLVDTEKECINIIEFLEFVKGL